MFALLTTYSPFFFCPIQTIYKYIRKYKKAILFKVHLDNQQSNNFCKHEYFKFKIVMSDISKALWLSWKWSINDLWGITHRDIHRSYPNLFIFSKQINYLVIFRETYVLWKSSKITMCNLWYWKCQSNLAGQCWGPP